MRKVIFAGAALVAALVALRRFGPALCQRVMKKCGQMFERNGRILDHLEQPDEGPVLAAAD